jgi:hypothetical protein
VLRDVFRDENLEQCLHDKLLLPLQAVGAFSKMS